MLKEIRFNAFEMNCVAHQSPGLWTHPRDRTSDYNRLPYWIDLARTLERGRFDGLFLADVLGVYDVFGNSADAALRNAAQTPANDPMMLIAAMAAVTENLGFGVTSNLSYEPPYPFARRMSTLDHLTEGRIGWNVVTGYLDSAARGAGKDKQTAHDDRYDVADEYMEVVYKLWEGSWEDDAALRDRSKGIFADPAKVHRIQHQGNNYRLDAIHLCEPSPQRTPVLYQAGTSPRGRQFAAQNAECVFMSGPSAKVIAPRVAAIRKALDSAGLTQTPILSYASKFASAFYGPFREAADSAPQFGDRRSYQMDGANLREAMREIDLDIEEGADMILMKPAMPYLDVVRAARERVDVPIGAYQVSGEYSMLHAAFEKGWLDQNRAMMESLVGIRRAGADFIVTYFAKDAAKLL